MKKRNLIIALAVAMFGIGETYAQAQTIQNPTVQSDTNKGIAFVEGIRTSSCYGKRGKQDALRGLLHQLVRALQDDGDTGIHPESGR